MLSKTVQRRAFTVVELVVVASIIAILCSLLLPAILLSRESSRNVVCRNHLRQIGLSLLAQETSIRHFPTNGWGAAWAGEPDKGSHRQQPGGWIYNTLPFMEQGSLHGMVFGSEGHERLLRVSQTLAVPVATFSCPSRRPAGSLPYVSPEPLRNSLRPQVAFRTDYAGNAGSGPILFTGPGPESHADAKTPQWQASMRANGIFFARSATRVAEITDGLSHTYLVGEKYIRSYRPNIRNDRGDDQCAYIGDSWDIRRMATFPPRPDGGHAQYSRFGSNHATTWNALFADGAVASLSFSIDTALHARHGNRMDSQP